MSTAGKSASSARSAALEAAVKDALSILSGSLTAVHSVAATHQVTLVSGWDKNAGTRRAVACYLVALRVCAVNAALKVRAQLTDTAASQAEVVRNVEAIVGTAGTGMTTAQIERVRNPWIAEALWHLCLCLAKGRPLLHPAGKIVAVSQPHLESTEHGIDVAAIYADGTGFGLSLVESKAYPKRPNSALADAAKFYRKVDAASFDLKIRQAIQHMRADLPQGLQQRVHEELWRRARCYIPNPHYDASCNINWNNPRPSLRAIGPVTGGVIIMPHAAANFEAYFDGLAREMLAFAKTL